MSRTLSSTPAADGFWMPSELAPHAGCWMLWPERPDNWRRGALPAQQAFAAVARAIVRFEPLTVGASAGQYSLARASLPPTVRVLEISSNDAWMRDVGPSFLVDTHARTRGVQWRFNAWGGLYRDYARDAQVAQKVLELAGCERYCAPLVTEGGAMHVDGQGTALVTEQSLLDPRRNPGLDRARIERLLERYLGVSRVIWLEQGVVEDETAGHIDNLACFARPGEVCLTWTDDVRDPQQRICGAALERLLAARDARGRRLRVHRIPSPGPLYLTRREARGILPRPGIRALRPGRRLAASYINFYAPNGALLLPLLDGRTDAAARRALQGVFPRRRIVGVPAREILLGGGNLHCITQQQPLAPARARPAARRGRR
ncbi:MAG TPA: agmatine deiminase [Steroidobacteraceae bacterium]|nr:agmatine deiminase [Steroidobacteraceae bacterium]